MPFAGLGLHILIALFFAVHAMRSGQQMYWLIILFSFPLLGSVVYFLVIYLPDSRLERGARAAVSLAAKTLDPQRALRDARAAFEYTPTAQHQMQLAAALLDAGFAEEATTNYEACLKGPFASDLDIRLGAARAALASHRGDLALSHVEQIRRTDANFRADQISILMAQSLAAAGRHAQAQTEFENAVNKFGSFECRAEYGIWAAQHGSAELASRLQAELQQSMQRWSKQTRELNRPLLRRLEEAYGRAAAS